MRKSLVAAALCAAMVVGVGAGSAFAGELTGNGKETPIKSQQDCDFETGECPAPAGPANSICAFSGLNDDPEEDGNRTQSWGTGASEAAQEFGGVSEFAQSGFIKAFGPGTECRGGFPTLGAPA